MRVSMVMPSVSASSHSVNGRAPVSESADVLEPADEFGELAGQFDAVAADVVERQRVVDPGVRVVGHRDAGQDAVDTETPGVVHEVDVVRPRDAAGRSPTGCSTARTQSVMDSRSSSVKPNRARTGAASAMLSTSLAVTLPSANASNCEATPSSGLVWISERSASLTRSRWAGCAPCTTSPSPKSATISGA